MPPKKTTGRGRGTSDLEPQTDPRAPIDGARLLAAARPVLKLLGEDLLERARSSPAVTSALMARHEAEKAARRTADAFPVWQSSFVDQVAAAWFLSCVFARTLEDRGLVSQARLAGPGAADSQHLFLELAPSLTERDYLLTTFRELARFPAARDLFDARHNPVWLLTPSAEAAKALLALFRAPGVDAPAFRFGQPDTRFLGDLYQDLNADVKERYALLQTPRFVESFILDRTLERAIQTFGLDDTTLIDPTCGSGHFLLGAFDRLFDHRLRNTPGMDARDAAKKALDAVYGSDINPYAVAIARFRLTLAYLDKAGYAKIADAPALPLHLVVADSLLHNPQAAQSTFAEMEGQTAKSWSGEEFALEDETAARDVLHRRFAAVVGNPPYITVKDAVLRERYRAMYPSAALQYSLGAPFTERFFQLGREGGYVGLITANSFMKREFGRKLIETVLPKVNLNLVVNTSGAYIPGHGTPTVLLFGTTSPPEGTSLLTVLAKRGEPSTPERAEEGLVWRSIADHWEQPGFDNEYISTTRLSRQSLARHPWSLGGGGATELKELLEERSSQRLSDVVDLIGFGAVTREDDVFVLEPGAARRWGIPTDALMEYGFGEAVRDWSCGHELDIFFPYSADGTMPEARLGRYLELLWRYRTQLWLRQGKGFKTKRDSGGAYYEYSMFYPDRQFARFKIAFAFVATHNHFVLDRGGKVFNRSAPIIKLPETATEDDHLALLAYLNSSTAAFYFRQAGHSKGSQGVNEGHKSELWEQFLEYSGTLVGTVPLPPRWQSLARLGRLLVELANSREECMPARSLASSLERSNGAFSCDFGAAPDTMQRRLVAFQEELDWEVYELFGLLTADTITRQGELRQELFGSYERVDVRSQSESDVDLRPGHRPFELLLDRGTTHWFERNGYAQEVAGPGAYSRALEGLLLLRTEAIRADATLRLLEQPEHKHRWTMRSAPDEAAGFATHWALKRIEEALAEPVPRRSSDIASTWQRSPLVARGLDGLLGSLPEWTHTSLRTNSVPFLSVLRHSEEGLTKRSLWERTWELQRAEDASGMPSSLAVPPKYDRSDFRDPNFFTLRGKLDVPKERFISYPGCESDEDKEPVYGWAGWNHLQQAQALAALYQKRKTEEAWGADRLTPMLAGLLELLPWVKQWHNEPSAEYNDMRLGDFFETFIDGECQMLGLTHDDLRAWRPADKTRAPRAKTTKAAAPKKKKKAHGEEGA